ncbi:MAG: hypothetical protein R2699_04755 [Acidimicrobiales bacterium]
MRDGRLDAGIVCTASHNPSTDSGVKLYGATGAQLDPAEEASVEAAIGVIDPLAAPAPHPSGGGVAVDAEARHRYLDDVVGPLADGIDGDLSLVYTALHGVGADLVDAAFERVGLAPPSMVASQRDPDGTFPTVPYPNPEEPGALDAAVDLASQRNADAVLANDPDADRLAVAAPLGPSGAWRMLTGDELGRCWRRTCWASAPAATVSSWRRRSRVGWSGGSPPRTACSSSRCRPGSSGWPAVLDRPELRFVFGYEEALGYAVTDRVLDKDGISAAVVAARLIGSLRAAGSGVEEALATLAERHGLHATRTLHLRMDAADGSAAEVVARVLDAVPSSDDRRVLARASGTEAMAKVYLEVVEPLAGGSADHLVARYRAAASRADVILDQLEGAARACLAAG